MGFSVSFHIIQQSYEVGRIIPILQMGTRRHRVVL